MVVTDYQKIGFERRTDFRTGKIYFLLSREIKVASYTFRIRPIHGNSFKEINFFEPKCTGPLLERLRLKFPETLSASYQTFPSATNICFSRFQVYATTNPT